MLTGLTFKRQRLSAFLVLGRSTFTSGEYMPLSAKGMKIRQVMRKEYGRKKGDRIFYASENKNKIRGLRLGKLFK